MNEIEIDHKPKIFDGEFCVSDDKECQFLNDCCDHCHLFSEHLCVDVNGNYETCTKCKTAYQKAVEKVEP